MSLVEDVAEIPGAVTFVSVLEGRVASDARASLLLAGPETRISFACLGLALQSCFCPVGITARGFLGHRRKRPQPSLPSLDSNNLETPT